MCVVTALVLLIGVEASCAESPESTYDGIVWTGSTLEPGPYTVGYQVMPGYDHSRPYPTGIGSRPVQVAIWYPAVDTDAPRMSMREYVADDSSETDPTKLTEADRAASIEAFMEEFGPYTDDPAELEFMLDHRPVTAIRDAAHRPGAFPILVYGPGAPAQAWYNLVLIEHLVSHGYIVVSTPCSGANSRNITDDLKGMVTQTRDMAFALGKAVQWPNADTSRIGTFGYSWGGWSNVMLAAGDQRIKALAMLDGTPGLKKEYVQDRINSLAPKEYPGFLDIPILELMHGSKASNSPMMPLAVRREGTAYDATPYADGYLVQMGKLSHTHFTSSNIDIVYSMAPNRVDPERTRIYVAGYEYICRCVKAFFDERLGNVPNAMVKLLDDASARPFWANSMNLQTERKTGRPSPPIGQDFIDFYIANGGEKALEVLRTARELDPGVVLFGPREMSNYGRIPYSEGDTQASIDCILIQLESHPKSERPLIDLAFIYEQTDRVEDAIAVHRTILEYWPDNERSARHIAQLQQKLEGGQ